jgi:hypothetical protein
MAEVVLRVEGAQPEGGATESETVQAQEHVAQAEETAAWQNALSNLGEQMGQLLLATQQLANRVPENMTELLQTQARMIESQQSLIRSMLGEQMETVRSLLTPPQPPAIVESPTETTPAVEPVEAVQSVPETRVRRYRGL